MVRGGDLVHISNMSKKKERIIDDLVTGKDICVLATTDGTEAHASLMNYMVDHAVMKFYMLSHKDSRKNKNLMAHPHVSLLIDRRDEDIALTVHGLFTPLKKKQTVNAILKLFLKKHPHLKDFAAQDGVELIRIQGISGQLVQGIDEEFVTKFKIG